MSYYTFSEAIAKQIIKLWKIVVLQTDINTLSKYINVKIATRKPQSIKNLFIIYQPHGSVLRFASLMFYEIDNLIY